MKSGVSRLFGLVGLVLLLCLAGITSTDHPAIFVSVPSLLITVGGAVLALLISFSPSQLLGTVRSAFGASSQDRPTELRIVAAARQYLLALGTLGFFIGMIAMLANLDDPSSIGLGMAIALLTVLYSVGLGEILLRAVEINLAMVPEAAAHQPGKSESGTAFTPMIFFVLMGMISMGVVLLSVMRPIAEQGPDNLVSVTEREIKKQPGELLISGELRIVQTARGLLISPNQKALAENGTHLEELAGVLKGYRNKVRVLVASRTAAEAPAAMRKGLSIVEQLVRLGVDARRLSILTRRAPVDQPNLEYWFEVTEELVPWDRDK